MARRGIRSRAGRLSALLILGAPLLLAGAAAASQGSDLRQVVEAEAARTRAAAAALAAEGRHDEALSLRLVAIATLEANLAPDDPLLARHLNSLALYLRRHGRPAEAAEQFRRALEVCGLMRLARNACLREMAEGTEVAPAHRTSGQPSATGPERSAAVRSRRR